MKKIIGIFGIAVIAMAMFFNTNIKVNSNGDLLLADLIKTAKADAEIGIPFLIDQDCVCKKSINKCVKGGWVSFRDQCGGDFGNPTTDGCQLLFPNGCP